jgi:hypothetical protein
MIVLLPDEAFGRIIPGVFEHGMMFVGPRKQFAHSCT